MDIWSRTLKMVSRDAKEYVFLASLVTLLIALSEILDYFELPFESQAAHLFTASSVISTGFVTSSVSAFGYAGVFVLMFLESASLPIPSEVVLPFAGFLVFKGTMSFEVAVLVATVAGICGALTDYYLALKLGRPIIERLFRWSRATPGSLDRLEKWLGAGGSWTVLVARFIPGMRSAISLPAGALRMRLRAFVTMTAIGAFGWSALLIYLGYVAGNLWQTALVQSSPLLGQVVLFAVAVASISYIVYFLAAKVRGRTTAMHEE